MRDRLFRVVGIITLTLLLAFAVAWVMLRSDTISRPSAAFLALIQTLSPAREVIAKCWVEQGQANGCAGIKDHLPKSISGETVYLVTDQKTLIGIDYLNRVVVVLTPRIESGNITWICRGAPTKALAKSCIALP
jgi:hypothetical protein